MMVPGGHAIMLGIELSQSLLNATHHWVGRNQRARHSVAHDAHLTLAFIGRNQDTCVGDLMLDVAEAVHHLVPETVSFTGRTGMFGYRRDCLAAVLEKDERLLALRGMILQEFHTRRVTIDTGFGFSPHVTLGKSTVKNDSGLRNSVISPLPLIVSGMVLKIGSELTIQEVI